MGVFTGGPEMPEGPTEIAFLPLWAVLHDVPLLVTLETIGEAAKATQMPLLIADGATLPLWAVIICVSCKCLVFFAECDFVKGMGFGHWQSQSFHYLAVGNVCMLTAPFGDTCNVLPSGTQVVAQSIITS